MSYLDGLVDRVLAPQRCIEPLIRPADAIASELEQPGWTAPEAPTPAATRAAPPQPRAERRPSAFDTASEPVIATPRAHAPAPSSTDTSTPPRRREPSETDRVDLGPSPTPAPALPAIEHAVHVHTSPTTIHHAASERVIERVVETRTVLDRAIEYVRERAVPPPAPALAASDPRPATPPLATDVPAQTPAVHPRRSEPSRAITPPASSARAAGPSEPTRQRARTNPNPVVRISIDRVIVHADTPTEHQAPQRGADRSPSVGLDEYLTRRDRDRDH